MISPSTSFHSKWRRTTDDHWETSSWDEMEVDVRENGSLVIEATAGGDTLTNAASACFDMDFQTLELIYQRARQRKSAKTPGTPGAIELLSAASPHVFRQQAAGKHEQDRADAVDLYPRIESFLKEHKAP